jgi:hypothetical protein
MDYQLFVCLCVCVCVFERKREEIANLRQFHIRLQWRYERTHQLDDLTPNNKEEKYICLQLRLVTKISNNFIY